MPHRCGTLVNCASHHPPRQARKAAWWHLLPQSIASGKAMSWSAGWVSTGREGAVLPLHVEVLSWCPGPGRSSGSLPFMPSAHSREGK